MCIYNRDANTVVRINIMYILKELQMAAYRAAILITGLRIRAKIFYTHVYVYIRVCKDYKRKT